MLLIFLTCWAIACQTDEFIKRSSPWMEELKTHIEGTASGLSSPAYKWHSERGHRLVAVWTATTTSKGLSKLREANRKYEFLERLRSCQVSMTGDCSRCMLVAQAWKEHLCSKSLAISGASTENLNLSPGSPLTWRQQWAMKSQPLSPGEQALRVLRCTSW